MEEVLHLEYVSSEEDETEEAAKEAGRQTRGRLVKVLPWQSRRLITMKRDLDRFYITKVASPRQKRCMTQIVGMGQDSERQVPDNAVKWAIV